MIRILLSNACLTRLICPRLDTQEMHDETVLIMWFLYGKLGFNNNPRSFAVLLGNKSFPDKDRVIS